MYNMLLSDDGKTFAKKEKWLKVADVTEWVVGRWGSLTQGRDRQSMESNASVAKCLQGMCDASKTPAKDTPLVELSEDGSKVLLKHTDMARLQIKPLNATTIPPALLGQTLSAKPERERKEPKESGGGANKRKRGAGAKKEGKEAGKEAPEPHSSAIPMSECKLPDKYRLLPVPKADAAGAQREDVVQLSRAARAPQVALKDEKSGDALYTACAAAAAHAHSPPPPPPPPPPLWTTDHSREHPTRPHRRACSRAHPRPARTPPEFNTGRAPRATGWCARRTASRAARGTSPGRNSRPAGPDTWPSAQAEGTLLRAGGGRAAPADGPCPLSILAAQVL